MSAVKDILFILMVVVVSTLVALFITGEIATTVPWPARLFMTLALAAVVMFAVGMLREDRS